VKTPPRNPGPSWGYAFLQGAMRVLPERVFRWGLRAGAVVGWAVMPAARSHTRAYWEALLGRPPSWREEASHFADFAECLAGKLALAHGRRPAFHFHDVAQSADFREVCEVPGPVLFGSFHLGEADLMGAMLADFGRTVHMVRLRVENSRDTETLGRALGETLRFIWINQPEDMLFALKNALQAGHSIALHCDREQFGARREAFEFLGKRRWFPLTIYHLSALFDVPVAFAFALRRDARGSIPVVTAPVFRPLPDRRETLRAGAAHFQTVLRQVESLLREDPALWFNFSPLNTPVP
jgi:predicted LPLAT superfamily acyltransferase